MSYTLNQIKKMDSVADHPENDQELNSVPQVNPNFSLLCILSPTPVRGITRSKGSRSSYSSKRAAKNRLERAEKLLAIRFEMLELERLQLALKMDEIDYSDSI